MSRCIHDMIPDQCAICLRHSEPEVEARAFEAKFKGLCAECRTWIEVGDPIVLVDAGCGSGKRTAVHQECAS